MDKKLKDLGLEEFDFSLDEHVPTIEQRPITLWVPKEVHAQYSVAQKRSDRKFGKYCKRMIAELLKRLNA